MTHAWAASPSLALEMHHFLHLCVAVCVRGGGWVLRHTFCFGCLANAHAPASCDEHSDWRDRLERAREARRKLNEELGGGVTIKEDYNRQTGVGHAPPAGYYPVPPPSLHGTVLCCWLPVPLLPSVRRPPTG